MYIFMLIRMDIVKKKKIFFSYYLGQQKLKLQWHKLTDDAHKAWLLKILTCMNTPEQQTN